MKKIYVLMSSVIAILLSGCGAITPELMKNHIHPTEPSDVTNAPVVFFFQGSGGTNTRAYDWSSWFDQYGVASVIIDNAKVRSSNKLYGVEYASDLSVALEALKSYEDIDLLNLNKYAVMGFSRGGTMAMKSNYALKEGQAKPDLVFALYPGDSKGCPNSYGDKTDVHIFYGELDDWGTYKGIRSSCKSTASFDDKVSFYLLKNAHHGYDEIGYYSRKQKWTCCGGKTFTNEANPEALEETKRIILKAIKSKWGVKKNY